MWEMLPGLSLSRAVSWARNLFSTYSQQVPRGLLSARGEDEKAIGFGTNKFVP